MKEEAIHRRFPAGSNHWAMTVCDAIKARTVPPSVWVAMLALSVAHSANAQELVSNTGTAPDRRTDWIHGDTVLRSRTGVSFWIESIHETAQKDGAISVFTFYRGDCATMRMGMVQRRLLLKNGEERTEPARANVKLSSPSPESRPLLVRACDPKPFPPPVNNRRPVSEAMWRAGRNPGLDR